MSVPSLRQKQINEVLDYHRLINRTVFDRNVKSVFASNQAKSEPHRTDIETEANLRERVDKIKNILQQIIQFTSYGETSIDPTTGGESKEGTMEGRTIDTSATFLKSRSDTALASLLSEYNGICGLYDLKNRAHVFSESESTALAGIVRELKEPLTATIGTLMANKGKNKSYFQYYRVIKTVMENIDSAPPFLKIQPSLLTEPYFIPDPSKVKVVDAPLWKHMLESRDEVVRKLDEYEKIPVSSETEKRAKQKAVATLTKVISRIDELIQTNEKALRVDNTSSWAQANKNTSSLSELLADKSLPGPMRTKIQQLKKDLEKADASLLGDADEPDSMMEMFNTFFDDSKFTSDKESTEFMKDVYKSADVPGVYKRTDRFPNPAPEEEEGYHDYHEEKRQYFTDKQRYKDETQEMQDISRAYRDEHDPRRKEYLQTLFDEMQIQMFQTKGRIERYESDLKKKYFTVESDVPIRESPTPDLGEAYGETDSYVLELNKLIDIKLKKLSDSRRAETIRKLRLDIDELKEKIREYNKNRPSVRDRPTVKARPTSEGSMTRQIDNVGNQVLTDSKGPYYIQYDPNTGRAVKKVYYPDGIVPKGKGKPIKKGGNDFADDSVLAPYLTKRLKPSKFTKPKPESESDNPDDGTSEEEGGKKPTRKKRSKKPLIDNKRDEDLWFM